MTAKEFLEEKTLTAVETVGTLVINLVIGDAIYGMDVDTSNIPQGTLLLRTEDFTLENDTLTANELSIDLSTTDMFGDEKPKTKNLTH
jgi:hypothetical protein